VKSLEDFKAQCDIVKVVSHYVALEKAGSSYKGLCPFHEEKTPSFYVNPVKGFFHCFGCGASGDVIEFVKKIENVSFSEAVQKVADICNIDSPLISSDGELSKYSSFMEKLVKSYAELLFSSNGKAALSYLVKDRKLDVETLKKFEIGYAPKNSNIVNFVASKVGFDVANLLKYGLVSRSTNGTIYEFFRDRIIFPIKNNSGRIVALGGRVVGEGEPKYINSSENKYFSKSKILYLFDKAKAQIKENDFVIICEGYMDAIAFHKNGFENACAVLGVGLTQMHLESIKSLTNNLLLVLDSDKAGLNAMEKLSRTLSKYDLNVKVLTFTDAKDPDEYFRMHDKKEFKNFLLNAINYWDFYVRMILKDTSDVSKAIKRFADATKWIDSPILRSNLVKIVSKNLMIEENELLYELKIEAEEKSNNKLEKDVKISRMNFEDWIVYLLFANEDIRNKILKNVSPDYLSEFPRKVFNLVSEGHIYPQEILGLLTVNEGQRFFKIVTKDMNINDFDEALKVVIKKINEKKIRSDISKLEEEMKSTKDPEKQRNLQRKMLSLYAVLKGKRGEVND
jgi:DNA primase